MAARLCPRWTAGHGAPGHLLSERLGLQPPRRPQWRDGRPPSSRFTERDRKPRKRFQIKAIVCSKGESRSAPRRGPEAQYSSDRLGFGVRAGRPVPDAIPVSGSWLARKAQNSRDARVDLLVQDGWKLAQCVIAKAPIAGAPKGTVHRGLKSASGQKRKSSVALGMSGVGGRAEVDFGRLHVSL